MRVDPVLVDRLGTHWTGEAIDSAGLWGRREGRSAYHSTGNPSAYPASEEERLLTQLGHLVPSPLSAQKTSRLFRLGVEEGGRRSRIRRATATTQELSGVSQSTTTFAIQGAVAAGSNGTNLLVHDGSGRSPPPPPSTRLLSSPRRCIVGSPSTTRPAGVSEKKERGCGYATAPDGVGAGGKRLSDGICWFGSWGKRPGGRSEEAAFSEVDLDDLWDLG